MTLSIAGNTYTLTGTLGDDLIVEYHADFDQAISLGTVGAIAPSIANALSFPDLAKEITNTLNEVGSLPVIGQIGSILLKATARITDLEINTQAKTYGVGLALDFTQLPPNTPTPSVFGITLLSLGFKVTRTNPAQTSSTTPTSPTSPTSPTPRHSTYIADVMTDPPTSGNPPATPGTEIELLASLQIFGLPVNASATFGSGIDTILAARFGNIMLGDVLTYLVNKAEPGLDFKLTPPWDLLNTINLHDFAFEVDLTNFRVGFRYDGLDFSFPLISLDRIEVWYSPATKSRNKSVDLSLFGSFLGIDFSNEPGLTWDVLSQPAPSVPGQGPKVFDLEYVGFGQHVTLRDTASLATLADVITALEGSYANVDPHSNPLDTLAALKFDASSGWLFGAKFSAMDTVTLSAVFNDPVLYGLRLALDGKRAGNLAGLEFEILYRKVSNNLGVFHIELQLPDAVRKQQFGEANITLPIIDLDIYTNGDFLLDLGFPRGLNFSRSFQMDMIVWVGPIPIPVSAAAGLYFGVLSGQTASQVPQVTNGSFAPVIVAGFGVEVGIGYSVSIGPLEAGFFAGFIGILEGVLAWFHPDSDPNSPTVYLKVTGTVGIQIHIWGTVNFAILQASLDINAYATATVVIESYQPVEVAFEAGIAVSVSVRVLFFSIRLSFSATIRESFTIGQASPPRG